MEKICFLKLDKTISLQQIKAFFTISSHKPVFCPDKQLTPSESWDQDGFFEPGFGYHQLQIIGLEFLQHSGHQIRVNTWTGSYI